MKKILSILISLFILFALCPAFFAENPAVISVTSAVGKPGDTITVFVSISEDTNLGNSRIDFLYDINELEYIGSKAEGVGVNSIVAAVPNASGVSVGFITSSGIREEGNIFSVSFRIISSKIPSRIDISVSVPEFVDADTDLKIPNTVNNTFIIIAEKINGDLDFDGSVTISDAMLGFLWLAGKVDLDETALVSADMNDDRATGICDIMKIFMLVADSNG